MRLRSFSLSKIVPVEIINFIIHESSRSTLHAWCLVSFSCLSIAGPLLNENVHLKNQKQILRVLQRMTLDETDPLVLLLPRLSIPLSLNNLRRLFFLAEPDPLRLEAFVTSALSPQPERPRLEVVFSWAARLEAVGARTTFRSFLAPILIKLLRPGSFSEGPTGHRLENAVRVSSWALQCYLLLVDQYPPSALGESEPRTTFNTATIREKMYRSVLDFQRGKDNTRGLLAPKVPGFMEADEEEQRLQWLEKIEVLDREQVQRLEVLRREGGDVEDGLDILNDAYGTARVQLDEVAAFLQPIAQRHKARYALGR